MALPIEAGEPRCRLSRVRVTNDGRRRRTRSRYDFRGVNVTSYHSLGMAEAMMKEMMAIFCR